MPKPIAYKTGTIQPPNTAKQNNILVGVGPSNWGAGAANANFYNSLDSSYQYVIVKNSAVPAMWGTGDFTTGSLLTTINGLPDRVGQTRFTNANTAISWSLASGEYTILKNEQVYGGPTTNGLIFSVNGPSTGKNLFNAATYPDFSGWGYYGNFYSYDITNDPPYPGSLTKTAIRLGGIYCSSGWAMEAGKTYTFSFWMKKIFWPSDGVIGWNNQFGSGETNTWQGGIGPTPGNGWIKYSYTFTLNASRYYFYFYCYSPTDSSFRDTTGGVICAEFQLEEGSVATSYALPSVNNSISLKPINEGLINSSSISLNNGANFRGNRFTLDGIDDSISIPNSTDYTSFTISMWVKINAYNASYTYLFDCPSAFFLRANSQAGAGSNSSWLVCNHGGPDGGETGTVYTGSITHIAYSYDGSLYSGSFYINGVKTSGGPRPSNIKLSGNMIIGAGESYTNMDMYSTKVYNKVLTPSEIDNLYNSEAPTYVTSSIFVNQGLTLYLDATNPNCYPGSGTSIYDLSGYGNNGTLYNGVAYSSTYGGGLVFDGVDDYIVIPGNGTVNASKPTVELVMTTSTNGGNIIAQGQYGSNWGFGVGVKSGAIMARNNNGDANYSVSNSGLVHVVVVWDGSGNQYYKNGQYLGRTTTNYSPNPGGDVTIGGVRNQVPQSTLTEFANSTVNIVRIYNRALSPTEILQNFNSIKTQFGL